MAKMVDMAQTAQEKKAIARSYGETPSDADVPTYSWGLKLRLEQAELKKLGITDLPAVGAEVNLDIIAKVTRVSQDAQAKNTTSVVELQITKMGLEQDEDDEQDEAEPNTSTLVGYHGKGK